MERLFVPEQLKDGNLAEGWRKFRREFEQFLEATEKTEADDRVKVNMLLRVVGERGNDIYENFKLTGADKMDYAKVLAEYNKFCEPQDESFISRHRLLCMKQDGLSIEEFETKLRTQARKCVLGELTDDLTCHAFVEGVDDKKLRDKLLMKAIEGGLTLGNAIKLGREYTAATEHMKEVGKELNEGVHKLKELNEGVHKLYVRNDKPTGNNSRKEQMAFKFCGGNHKRGAVNCPAWGKQCRYCSRQNHFEGACMQKARDLKSGNLKTGEPCMTMGEPQPLHEELLAITVTKEGKKLIAILNLEGKDIRCQLDTAAARNIITSDYYEKLGRPNLNPSSVTLVTYDGTEIRSEGKVVLAIDDVQKIEFEVVSPKMPQMPIVGLETCLQLGLIHTAAEIKIIQQRISKKWITHHYEEVFTGLGEMPGEYEIRIDDSVNPVQHRPRRTPVMLRADIINKIKELETAGVVSRVDEPTDWISSLVAFRKPNGKIRPCLDPKDLNRAIVRNHYPIPTLDDVLPKLTKAKCFSLLDAKDGFLQVKLAEKSRKLTTFWTPLGRYCWNRLPFGLSSAPEEYQRRLHMVLDGLEGTEVIADDILVYGVGETVAEARQDHDDKIVKVLDRLKEKLVKINRDKMKMHLTEIKYMGHLLTAEGIKPDPAKIQGLRNIPYPKDKQDVKRFLGTINYLAKFIPHLSEMAESLRDIAKESAEYEFAEVELNAWNKLVDTLSEDTLLRYYDPNKPAVIECDASSRGLGAVLLQEGRPVSFASRTLNETERKYHPLKLECLAVVYACTKFDQYIYGKKDVTVLSDHRPLETIFKKEMDKSPLRLQKMLLSLQRYGLELEYRPGHEQVVADMLSRATLNADDDTAYQNNKSEVFLVDHEASDPTEYTDTSDMRRDRLKSRGAEDSTYQQLMQAILMGWPKQRDRCSKELQNYWTFQEELAVRGQLVYKGMRLVVPRNMGKEICEALHGAHQAAESMMRRARDILYWPGMAEDIQNTAEGCRACQLDKPRNQRETIRMHEVPTKPFAKVGTDIMYHQGKPHLVVVDYMSDYIEVIKLEDETAETIINACKTIFARHGIPIWVQSDNAPYYASSEFKRFAEAWQFKHTTSSPTHAESNGKAESAVKIVKHLFKTAADPWKALLEWRASPNRDFRSPSERLFSRKLRTLLPQPEESYVPKTQAEEEVARAREVRQRRIATSYNKSSQDLDPLKHGQSVLIRTVNDRAQKWRPASVLESVSDRSYLLQNEGGNIIRRNRVDLQAIPDDTPVPKNYGIRERQDSLTPSGRKRVEQRVATEQETGDTQRVARSGRLIKKPSYLSDYVQY